MDKKKFRTTEEIIKIKQLEKIMGEQILNTKYQATIRMVSDKNENYLNFDYDKMVRMDVINLISLFNQSVINYDEFYNRMELVIGYNIMFYELNKGK